MFIVHTLDIPLYTCGGYQSSTSTAVSDSAGAFGYFAIKARLYKVSLSTMVIDSYLQFDTANCYTVSCPSWKQPVTGVVVGNYGYFAWNRQYPLGSACLVLKVNVETVTLVPGCLAKPAAGNPSSGGALVASGAYVYFLVTSAAFGSNSGTFSKIRQTF